MTTTSDEIRSWFDCGVKHGHAYMVVWCDTFEWSDYPAYHDTEEAAQRDVNTNGQNMKRLMEVYDLRKPRDAQIGDPWSQTMALRPKH